MHCRACRWGRRSSVPPPPSFSAAPPDESLPLPVVGDPTLAAATHTREGHPGRVATSRRRTPRTKFRHPGRGGCAPACPLRSSVPAVPAGAMAEKDEPVSDKEAYENLRKQMNYALIKVRCSSAFARAIGLPDNHGRLLGLAVRPISSHGEVAMAAIAAAVPSDIQWLSAGRVSGTFRGQMCWRLAAALAFMRAFPVCLRQNCDMNEEMRQDCVDLVITACERYAGNFEVRSDRIPVTDSHWGHCERGSGGFSESGGAVLRPPALPSLRRWRRGW